MHIFVTEFLRISEKKVLHSAKYNVTADHKLSLQKLCTTLGCWISLSQYPKLTCVSHG